LIEVPTLRHRMLKIAVDDDKLLTGRHTNQRIRPRLPPVGDDIWKRRRILEAIRGIGSLVRFAGKDGIAYLGKLERSF